jgi:hypothetical protein
MRRIRRSGLSIVACAAVLAALARIVREACEVRVVGLAVGISGGRAWGIPVIAGVGRV